MFFTAVLKSEGPFLKAVCEQQKFKTFMYSIAPEIFGSLPPGTPIQKNLSIKWYFIFILSEGWLFIYRPTNPYTKKLPVSVF